jgi:hypothetical protein
VKVRLPASKSDDNANTVSDDTMLDLAGGLKLQVSTMGSMAQVIVRFKAPRANQYNRTVPYSSASDCEGEAEPPSWKIRPLDSRWDLQQASR